MRYRTRRASSRAQRNTSRSTRGVFRHSHVCSGRSPRFASRASAAWPLQARHKGFSWVGPSLVSSRAPSNSGAAATRCTPFSRSTQSARRMARCPPFVSRFPRGMPRQQSSRVALRMHRVSTAIPLSGCKLHRRAQAPPSPALPFENTPSCPIAPLRSTWSYLCGGGARYAAQRKIAKRPPSSRWTVFLIFKTVTRFKTGRSAAGASPAPPAAGPPRAAAYRTGQLFRGHFHFFIRLDAHSRQADALGRIIPAGGDVQRPAVGKGDQALGIALAQGMFPHYSGHVVFLQASGKKTPPR